MNFVQKMTGSARHDHINPVALIGQAMGQIEHGAFRSPASLHGAHENDYFSGMRCDD
jgi:hypothetical protein